MFDISKSEIGELSKEFAYLTPSILKVPVDLIGVWRENAIYVDVC